MLCRYWNIGIYLWLVSSFAVAVHRTSKFPSFLPAQDNYTVSVGKDVTFTCNVQNVGDHKVAWIRMTDKTVLSVLEHILAKDTRLYVPPMTEPNYMTTMSSWPLTIKGVNTVDSGSYMCQLSTMPTLSQTSHLTVLTPPDIDDNGFSGDVIINEGDSTPLTCQASGNPEPRVSFKREDNRHFRTKLNMQARKWDGNELVLTAVSRQDAGAYLCIASNGVPPPVSRRMVVSVTFAPTASASNQLIASPVKTSIKLECTVQSFPKATISWYHQKGEKIVSQTGYKLMEIAVGSTEWHSSLTIESVSIDDFGTYRCLAENEIATSETTVRLHEIPATVYPPEIKRQDKKKHHTGKHSRDNIPENVQSSSNLPQDEQLTTKLSYFSNLKFQTSNTPEVSHSGGNTINYFIINWSFSLFVIICLYCT